MTSELSTLFPLADFTGALPLAGWIVAGIIVVGCMLIAGRGELARFSPSRIWAIGGVCFRESIRRRVLWIIPLAIVGVIIVSQLQKAMDEQDIVRQTTKFCLFATGLVVVLTSIILACTNLPREIDNRVIYTIVTKPTTRLELVIGKIVGFARISALILLIMGTFSYGYLRLRNWSQQQDVTTRLQNDSDLSAAEQNKLLHYQRAGLLTARGYAQPVRVEVMAPASGQSTADAATNAASVPTGTNPVRSMYGDSEEEMIFPFTVDRHRWFTSASGVESPAEGFGKTGLLIAVRMRWQRYGPANSDPTVKAGPPADAGVTVDVLDANAFSLVSSYLMFDPEFPAAKDAHTNYLPLTPENAATAATTAPTTAPTGAGPVIQSKWIWAYVPASLAGALYEQPVICVHVTGPAHNVQYFADGNSVFIMPAPEPAPGNFAPPIPHGPIAADQQTWPNPTADGKPAPPFVRGRLATRGGQELNGKPFNDPHGPFAVFHFQQQAGAAENADGTGIPLEMRISIEHSGDASDERDAITNMAVFARPSSGAGGPVSAPIDLKLENKQLAFAEIPAAIVRGGDFDVLMRCESDGHVLGVEPASLQLVINQEPFVWNLTKSLLIMWMLTVLVVALAILTSTFLSWPIAIVLTVVLLMGHWAVTQVADSADKTLGRSIATDMGLTDASKAEAVATSVNALTSSLNVIGVTLPDINRFAAIDSIEKGVVVSAGDMEDALGSLAAFALPAMVLAFVVLKNKEVAP